MESRETIKRLSNRVRRAISSGRNHNITRRYSGWERPRTAAARVTWERTWQIKGNLED